MQIDDYKCMVTMITQGPMKIKLIKLFTVHYAIRKPKYFDDFFTFSK